MYFCLYGILFLAVFFEISFEGKSGGGSLGVRLSQVVIVAFPGTRFFRTRHKNSNGYSVLN